MKQQLHQCNNETSPPDHPHHLAVFCRICIHTGPCLAEMTFKTLATVQYASLVAAVAVLHDGDTCVAGVRGSNYLRLYSLSALKVSSVAAPCSGTGSVTDAQWR